MKTITYEGIVENSQIKLPATVHLPEHTKVFVVVPGTDVMPTAFIRSPRLADPSKASDFKMEVTEDS